eukprot:TRINITY_DN3235_c0_g1_i1.p1 TRINITY_DN3235_c0_g1~~TRINITY_DN3235_c0_g1_i1.p1  ORF type:complete len:964 (-),score=79.44 TRINITY_DN3235_c0_g1_i1:652-3456(-)
MKRPFSGNTEVSQPERKSLSNNHQASFPVESAIMDGAQANINSNGKPVEKVLASLDSFPHDAGIEIISQPVLRDYTEEPPIIGDKLKFTVVSRSIADGRLVFKLKFLSDSADKLSSSEKGREFTVHTKSKWQYEEILEGDTVKVLGAFTPDTLECDFDQYDNDIYNGYIILEPDTYLTATLIASGSECMKRAFFDLAFPRAEPKIHYPMLLGTMVHEIFDHSLVRKERLEELNDEYVEGCMSDHYLELHLAGKSEVEEVKGGYMGSAKLEDGAKSDLKEYLNQIKNIIGSNFVEKKPLEGTDYIITDVIAIEQKMFSRRFGIKGQTDVTVEVQKVGSTEKKIAAIELKSGEDRNQLSHVLQCSLYALLLQELGCTVNEEQFLLYLKYSRVKPVKLLKSDYRDIIEKRNKLVQLQKRLYKGQLEIPSTAQKSGACRFCAHSGFCKLYCRAYNTDIEDIADPEENKGIYFNPDVVAYFKKWNYLITLEQNTNDKKISSAYPWAVPVDSVPKKRGNDSEVAEESHLIMTELRRNGKDVAFTLKKHGDVDSDINFGTFVDIFCTETPLITLGRGRVIARDSVLEESKHRSTVLGLSLIDTNMFEMHNKKIGQESLKEKTWSIRCSTQSTVIYGFMRWALLGLCTTPAHARLRELIVELKPPAIPRMEFSVARITSDHSSAIKDLNAEQVHAIVKALNCEEYQLVLGVHGSGKSTTIAALLEILAREGRKVFYTANSHVALDSTLRKLASRGVKFLRVAPSRESVHPEIQPYITTYVQAQHSSNKSYIESISEINVLAATPFGATTDLLRSMSFEYCVVEEASQMLEPVCLGAILSSRRFVLFGDGGQHLPMVGNFQAKLGGFGQTLFDRLVKVYPENVAKLCKQYVMNRGVMGFINEVVYGGMMEFGSDKARDLKLLLPNRKLTQVFGLKNKIGDMNG